MNESADFGRYLNFIRCQIRPEASAVVAADGLSRWRALTLSRQSGTGGHLVAEEVTRLLQTRGPQGAASWMVFDRNLLERVLEDHQLPARLAKYMPEDRISVIQDTFDELFGLHPPTWTLVEKISDTILRLAQLGNVILLGRGANIITRRLDHLLHIRLVGSREARVAFVAADRKFDQKSAAQIVDQEDEGRRRYVKQYFHQDIDNPELYHLTINAPEIGHIAAAQIIAQTVLDGIKIPHATVAHHS